MDTLLSFMLVIGLAFVISCYGACIMVVCVIFRVFDKKQDYDYGVIKALWSFVIVTVVFYGLGKVGYWLIML